MRYRLSHFRWGFFFAIGTAPRLFVFAMALRRHSYFWLMTPWFSVHDYHIFGR